MYFIQRNCQLLHRRSHKAPNAPKIRLLCQLRVAAPPHQLPFSPTCTTCKPRDQPTWTHNLGKLRPSERQQKPPVVVHGLIDVHVGRLDVRTNGIRRPSTTGQT